MILDSAVRPSSHLPSNIPTSLKSDTDYYMQLRKQMCELMAYTRCYIARYVLLCVEYMAFFIATAMKTSNLNNGNNCLFAEFLLMRIASGCWVI
jgi:hypothetical protein